MYTYQCVIPGAFREKVFDATFSVPVVVGQELEFQLLSSSFTAKVIKVTQQALFDYSSVFVCAKSNALPKLELELEFSMRSDAQVEFLELFKFVGG